MAEIGIVRGTDQLRTTLGSCVGVALIDSKTGMMGLAHVMLPKAPEASTATPGKFADTAIPALLEKMGISLKDAALRVRAKIAGGANMFPNIVKQNLILIGDQNIQAVRDILRAAGIPVVAEDLGGTKGRLMVLRPDESKTFISCLGELPKEL